MALIHPFMVHFTITVTLLAMIRVAGVPFLEMIPASIFKWVVPPLLLLTVLSGQYSLEALKGEKAELLKLAKWHRGLGIGSAILATWVIFTFQAEKMPAKEEERNRSAFWKNVFRLPGLAILLILLTAAIGGIMVHKFRVGVSNQI
jgi:uncharacterized membrane protein